MPRFWKILGVALSLLASASQASGQGWEQFGFRKLGFRFEIPTSFALKELAVDRRGATFEADDGGYLSVWGHSLPVRHFKEAVQAHQFGDEEEGWDITYRRVTPRWASFSGVRDGRIRYFRAIAVCGDRVGFFQLDYAARDKLAYDPVIIALVRSLRQDGC